jgi:molybdopterin/thiamine biosynthesis adenylyltransferase
MTGFGSSSTGIIEVLDLDTIDLSNLNRQFLFQKQHVKRPKAVVRLFWTLQSALGHAVEHSADEGMYW